MSKIEFKFYTMKAGKIKIYQWTWHVINWILHQCKPFVCFAFSLSSPSMQIKFSHYPSPTIDNISPDGAQPPRNELSIKQYLHEVFPSPQTSSARRHPLVFFIFFFFCRSSSQKTLINCRILIILLNPSSPLSSATARPEWIDIYNSSYSFQRKTNFFNLSFYFVFLIFFFMVSFKNKNVRRTGKEGNGR